MSLISKALGMALLTMILCIDCNPFEIKNDLCETCAFCTQAFLRRAPCFIIIVYFLIHHNMKQPKIEHRDCYL